MGQNQRPQWRKPQECWQDTQQQRSEGIVNHGTTIKIAFALLCAGSLLGCAKSPESTVESFYKALGKGEIKEAKSYLSKHITGRFGDEKIERGMTGEARRIAACDGIKSIAAKLQGEGEIRVGETAITFNNTDKCPEKKEKVALSKEDGSWKIDLNK